jgi:hypothetical protein
MTTFTLFELTQIKMITINKNKNKYIKNILLGQ